MIELHLRIWVKADRLQEFFDFLLEAIPFYEQPGGIRILLFQDRSNPKRFIEKVEYADETAFLSDQVRVETDSQMQGYLQRWRELLEQAPEVEVYQTVGISPTTRP